MKTLSFPLSVILGLVLVLLSGCVAFAQTSGGSLYPGAQTATSRALMALPAPSGQSVLRINADGSNSYLTSAGLANWLGVTTDGALDAFAADPTSNGNFSSSIWGQNLISNPDDFHLGNSSSVNFVFAGDSLTTDISPISGAGNDYPEQLMRMPRFAAQGAYHNSAVAGWSLAQVSADYEAHVYPYRPAANGGISGVKKAYLIVPVGTNGWSGYASASAFVADWTAYLTQAESDGFTVIPFTIMRAQNESKTAMRWEINRLIRASKWGGRIVDWASKFPNTYQDPWHVDGVHLNAAGNLLVAYWLNAILTGNGNPTLDPYASGDGNAWFKRDGERREIIKGAYPPNGAYYSGGFVYQPNGAPADPGTSGYTCGFWIYWEGGETYALVKGGGCGYGVNGSGQVFFEGGRSGRYTSNVTIPQYAWTHIVFSRDASAGMRIAVNGLWVDTDSTATGSTPAPNRILSSNTTAFCSGVFWYSRALQMGEVEWIYSAGYPWDTTNLEYFYPVDAGFGDQLNDRSSHNYWAAENGGSLVWMVPKVFGQTSYRFTFTHSGISSSAATTLLFNLPKNCKILSFDSNVTTGFDAGITLSIGTPGTANKFLSAKAVNSTGLSFDASASQALESTSVATPIYIQKSGATTTGAINLTVAVGSIGLTQ